MNKRIVASFSQLQSQLLHKMLHKMLHITSSKGMFQLKLYLTTSTILVSTTMSVGKLYCADFSPPARSIYLAEKALGIEMEHIHLDLMQGEHKTPEYLALNPQHTVPMFVDQDGTAVWDSHAILAYLSEKYGQDDSLYPKDLKKRAVIDQRLHFDSGNIFAKLRTIVFGMWTIGEKGPSLGQVQDVDVQYGFLNEFLGGNPWMAGDSLTIADLSLIASVSSLQFLVPIDPKYSNLLEWIQRCEQLPYYEVNIKGAKEFEEFFKPWVIKYD